MKFILAKANYLFAIWIGELIRFVMRFLGRNADYLPEKIVLKICPDFLKIVDKPKTIVAVTSAYQNYTVTYLICYVLESTGQKVLSKKATGFGAERKAKKALEAVNNYYEIYRAELILYDAADKYMQNVMQDRYDSKKLPPITKWQEELANKTAMRDSLYQDYYTLKNETAKIEKIKRSVTEIMELEKADKMPQKSQKMEL